MKCLLGGSSSTVMRLVKCFSSSKSLNNNFNNSKVKLFKMLVEVDLPKKKLQIYAIFLRDEVNGMAMDPRYFKFSLYVNN